MSHVLIPCSPEDGTPDFSDQVTVLHISEAGGAVGHNRSMILALAERLDRLGTK